MSWMLQFLGATDTVTGSRYLLQSEHSRVLVDCGLFQGFKKLRDRNRAPFPVPPSTVDAVIVTHAHLDHTGYLPALVRDGFSGPIYATPGTQELCGLLLPDSGHLLEEEARYAAGKPWSSHDAPLPLYTTRDAVHALGSFHPVDFDKPVEFRDLRLEFVPAGHILGAAQVRIEHAGTRIHFTGDLGRVDDVVMRPPRGLEVTDYLVTESTYGDRAHPDERPDDSLEEVIGRVCGRGAVVLIPAFAVGRTETILLHLARLLDQGRIPDVPIFLNSPMAISAASIYHQHPEEHRLREAEIDRMYSIATNVQSADDSRLLNLRGGPMIIISASGMLTGGRILHHIKAYGGDRRNAIILTGYQAGGTRGAALASGARTLRIFGSDVPIKAEVIAMTSLSAHADAAQLLEWMRAAPMPPAKTFITHGEPAASDTLRASIKRRLHWNAHVPEHLERVDLTPIRSV